MSNLQNKIAVITGAAGTLCSAIARDLAGRGARVALLGRTEKKVIELADAINASGGKAVGIGADVTHADDVCRARDRIRAEWGDAVILINGAGGKDPKAVTATREFDKTELDGAVYGFFKLDLGAVSREVELNTLGTILPSQIFGEGMARQGNGCIINFASMTSYRPLSRTPGYSLSKAGIINFTQWLAAYLAPAGIRVNAIAPGFFLNERSRKLLLTDDGGFSARGKEVVHHTPMKRFGEADELLGAVRWLLNDEDAGFVTGICVPVDGGFLAAAGV